METVFQCEWDTYASKILERHWPSVPRWEDIATLTGRCVLGYAPVVDVVAWGSPCQDLSSAGKRAGLSGERSGLFYEGIRLIKEILEETNGKYPRISIWENVYGALNSNKGADFGLVLDEMAEAGALVQEWRVLDAQYFGVPQQRRRVFLVSVFDPGIAANCPDPLLPFEESLPGNIKESKKEQQKVTKEIAACLRSGGSGGLPSSRGEHLVVGSLAARDYKGVGNQYVAEGKCIVEDLSVRRLTPIECERLMGWPDDWTSGQADSHRYKQCGNGVVSPVATWIAKKIIHLL